MSTGVTPEGQSGCRSNAENVTVAGGELPQPAGLREDPG